MQDYEITDAAIAEVAAILAAGYLRYRREQSAARTVSNTPEKELDTSVAPSPHVHEVNGLENQ
jgi:hypothetical protein